MPYGNPLSHPRPIGRSNGPEQDFRSIGESADSDVFYAPRLKLIRVSRRGQSHPTLTSPDAPPQSKQGKTVWRSDSGLNVVPQGSDLPRKIVRLTSEQIHHLTPRRGFAIEVPRVGRFLEQQSSRVLVNFEPQSRRPSLKVFARIESQRLKRSLGNETFVEELPSGKQNRKKVGGQGVLEALEEFR